VLDSILCEKMGIPAIAIVTDAFVETGKLMAAKWGVAEFRFLAVPHPVANLSDAELDRRAFPSTFKVKPVREHLNG
jgi:hypothetical protein